MNELKGLIAQIEYLGAKVSQLQGRMPSLQSDLDEVLGELHYAWRTASSAWMILQEDNPDAHA